MYSQLVTIAFVCGVWSLIEAQKITPGVGCPSVTLDTNFQPALYFNGTYYQQARIDAPIETSTKCNLASYSVVDPINLLITVQNQAVDIASGQVLVANGEGYCDSTILAQCYARFRPTSSYGNYHVIESDPNSYGLVYSCHEINGNRHEFAWILTRDRNPSTNLVNGYLAQFQAIGILASDFLMTDQRACPAKL